jgi:CubicO group peptidase (beta-lactamase class C family)
LPRGSFGWSGAYGTHFWVDPVNKITAIYMKNSDYSGGAGCTTAEIFEDDVMGCLE